MNRSDQMLVAVALVLVTALGGVVALGSCGGNAHLREDFAVQSHEFFDRQARAAASGTTQGLDSEEAALIHQSYRETLGQRVRQRDRGESPVLLLENGYEAQRQR